MIRSPLFLFASCLVLGCGSSTEGAGEATPEAEHPDTIVYDSTAFTLQPGEEKILCEYVPADGKERSLRGFSTSMTPGSHHLVVFRIDETLGAPGMGLEPCTQIELPPGFDAFLPGSQERESAFSLPDGVVMSMKGTHGLYFQMHYINTTNEPITAKVHWVAEATDPSPDDQLSGILFYSNFGLYLPPLSKSTATKTCKAPADIHLLTGLGHMHKHGLTFDATVAGDNVYHADTWDEPPGAVYPGEGYPVHAGDPIEWTCTFDNDTPDALVFGNSAATNEMCIFASLFYPSPSSATDFGCLH